MKIQQNNPTLKNTRITMDKKTLLNMFSNMVD